MKLLCVERDRHGKLQVGAVYHAVGERTARCCGTKVWFIEEFPSSHAGLTLAYRCNFCGGTGMETVHSHCGFLQRRFVPWNPDELKVTEREVRELYQPDSIVRIPNDKPLVSSAYDKPCR